MSFLKTMKKRIFAMQNKSQENHKQRHIPKPKKKKIAAIGVLAVFSLYFAYLKFDATLSQRDEKKKQIASVMQVYKKKLPKGLKKNQWFNQITGKTAIMPKQVTASYGLFEEDQEAAASLLGSFTYKDGKDFFVLLSAQILRDKQDIATYAKKIAQEKGHSMGFTFSNSKKDGKFYTFLTKKGQLKVTLSVWSHQNKILWHSIIVENTGFRKNLTPLKNKLMHAIISSTKPF